MRSRVSRKSPHGKQRPPGGITRPSPNTQTIIQIIDIYWGKMKEKKLHVHADCWVNFVCLRIKSRFRFLTSLSEWMEQLLLNIRKMEEGFNLSQIEYWVWRALSSHSLMANRHSPKQCITDITRITPRHNICMLWTHRECTSPAGISLLRAGWVPLFLVQSYLGPLDGQVWFWVEYFNQYMQTSDNRTSHVLKNKLDPLCVWVHPFLLSTEDNQLLDQLAHSANIWVRGSKI